MFTDRWRAFLGACVRLSAVAGMIALSPVANAVYNANTGNVVVTYVGVYADGDYIYFQVSNPPTHSACSNAYFVIPDDVPQNRRNQMLSALLSSKVSGTTISIGYDGVGSCYHGYIRVHRV